MSSIVIRQAQEIDIKALVTLCKESLLASFGDLVEPDKLRPWSEGNDIEKYIQGSWPGMRVAVDGPDLVGMINLRDNRVDIVWVSQAMRQCGIGQLLMDASEEQVSQNHETIEVECLGPDIETIQFYQRRGYSKLKEYEDKVSGVDKIVMSKNLTA